MKCRHSNENLQMHFYKNACGLARLKIVVIWAVLLFCGTGCEFNRIRNSTHYDELESQSVFVLARALAFHEGMYPGIPVTNVVQLYSMFDLSQSSRTHPYVLQKRFRAFGKKAGFEHSIYEKYVLVPSGITNARAKGELVIIGSQPLPYPDWSRRTARMAIWRGGKQEYHPYPLPEEEIQQLFKDAGITVPKPVSLPPPPKPENYVEEPWYSFKSIRLFFADLAGDFGPGRSFWFPMMVICILGVAVGIIGFGLLVWWVLGWLHPSRDG